MLEVLTHLNEHRQIIDLVWKSVYLHYFDFL